MKPSLGPDSVIPKWFYFVYNVFCFGLMHHYRVSGPRSAKKVAPSKEVPIYKVKSLILRNFCRKIVTISFKIAIFTVLK